MQAMRQVADAVMGAFARLLVRIFFRRIEVEGTEHLVAGTPTVLVANHQNGLVDGLLLMATLRRYPRFLGKSTLFKILPLWPFLKLAGVVPVYRAKDGVSTNRNAAHVPDLPADAGQRAGWWRSSPRASATTSPSSSR